jgi:hypothetical protein
VGRAQNVDSIYLKMIDDADRPNDLSVARKIDINFFAQIRCKLFRIVEFAMPKSLRQNDCGGDDWAGQGAAPGFIDPCDAGNTDGAQFLFVTKSTAPIH